MEAVLAAAARGCDLLVVDLPRRPDHSTEVALASADRTFLVVPAEVRAVASAARVATAIRDLTTDLGIVVRLGSGALDPELVGRSLGLDVFGRCRAEPGLAAALDRGEPPGRGRGPLARVADDLIRDLLAKPTAAA
jgi:hypothetical protein